VKSSDSNTGSLVCLGCKPKSKNMSEAREVIVLDEEEPVTEENAQETESKSQEQENEGGDTDGKDLLKQGDERT